jgi:uncharacterized protein (TIGR03790 family)
MFAIGMAATVASGASTAAEATHAPSATAASASAGAEPAGSAALAASGTSGAPARSVRPRAAAAPRVIGRVAPSQIGLVINRNDPYSVEVGAHYQAQRMIPPERVLTVDLPVDARLAPAELERLRQRIAAAFGPDVQALALAWNRPYAVGCQSITSAVTLGLHDEVCANTCGRNPLSPYFNSASGQPFRDHGLRPSMLLAAGSAASARALVERGVAAEGRLGLRGGLPVDAAYMSTADAARNVRAPLFPPAGPVRGAGVRVQRLQGDLPQGGQPLLLVQTGAAVLRGLDRLEWVPGGLGDHLTSFGGLLDGSGGQTSALAWIDSGATASYGTVSEPCNHLQKFPHPQLLLLHYLQGSTAVEAYWKSVAWPQQGVFIGDPLAAPFARR